MTTNAWQWAMVVSVLFCATSCSNTKNNDKDGNENSEQVSLNATDFTYTLEESTADLPLWTTPVTRRVRLGDAPPDARKSGISLAAAKNEFEPFQLLLGPGKGDVTVSFVPFTFAGLNARVDMFVASYVEGRAESLTALPRDGRITLNPKTSTPLWVRLHVPTDTPAKIHTAALHIVTKQSKVNVPVSLRVFDFALPDAIHFASQFNLDVSSLIPPGGTVDDARNTLFDHRMTPASPAWPSGFNPKVTWDNPASPNRCTAFYDEPDEADAYSIKALSRRCILGENWNGTGFPDSMLFQFVNNATPRPDEFCGEARGDHFGTAAYNAKWSLFLSGLDEYLVSAGMAERTYYYVQNEPQNDTDHELANHLCRLVRAAAPNLRIAVSDEAKPEIAEHPNGDCGYDIWIAHVRAYKKNYAWQRERDNGEVSWLYSLDNDPDPYFNPTRADLDGVHQRIIPWVAFTLRARGFAYYDAKRFFNGHEAGIRAELFREGFEDYEYLYLATDQAQGGAYPPVFREVPVDVTARSVASSLTSWTRDSDALAALRIELGAWLEGSRDTLPTLASTGAIRPAGAYAINFQDPDGEPVAEPLVENGYTWIKVGWTPWNDNDGLGWYGEHIGNKNIALYGYDAVDGGTETSRSYIYDDYGRDNLFEFSLASGTYLVTVGAGRPGASYPNDPHRVVVEGVAFIDDEPTSDASPVFERAAEVTVLDGRLSVETGGLSPSTNNWSYTFLSWLRIEPLLSP